MTPRRSPLCCVLAAITLLPLLGCAEPAYTLVPVPCLTPPTSGAAPSVATSPPLAPPWSPAGGQPASMPGPGNTCYASVPTYPYGGYYGDYWDPAYWDYGVWGGAFFAGRFRDHDHDHS